MDGDALSGTGHTDRKRLIAIALCVVVALAVLPKSLSARIHQAVPIEAAQAHDSHPGAPADIGHTHADCGVVMCNLALHSSGRTLPTMGLSRRRAPIPANEHPGDNRARPEPPVPR